MSPKALIFSSDQETSRLLNQALIELGFDVTSCVEIFAAVEKLTSRGFELIAADWDDGVEASFLLKTARELKANSESYMLALCAPELAAAAKHAGTDIVLNKPLLPGQATQTLLGSKEFAAKFQREQMVAINEPTQAANPYNQLVIPPPPSPKVEAPVPSFLKKRTLLPPSPKPQAEIVTSLQDDVVALGEHLNATPTNVPASGEQLRRSSIQTLFSNAPQLASRKPGIKLDLKKFWRGSVYSFFLIALGLFLHGPVRKGGLSACGKIFVQEARATIQSTFAPKRPQPVMAEAPPLQFNPSYLSDRIERISVDATPKSEGMPPEVSMAGMEAHPLEALAQFQPLPVMPQLQAPASPLQPSTKVLYESVPQSLRTVPQVISVRDSGLKPSPSLLSILEPVKVDEDVAERLLMRKVAPVYPDQALRSGMQGIVVLQALISKEGTVEDLKLVGGSMVLGEAAVQAVRQWHYQPYFINGRPVQTQTQVTVEFKLPALAAATPVSKP
ncbi:MAG TPA: TonB family protein [Terriglobales bacterium]|nr:TonB family protein [Terriglobales bacterium]